MIVNLVKIEEDIIKIHDKSIDENKGREWSELARYIAAKVLENRIDQANECTAISVLELELAGIEGKTCQMTQ